MGGSVAVLCVEIGVKTRYEKCIIKVARSRHDIVDMTNVCQDYEDVEDVENITVTAQNITDYNRTDCTLSCLEAAYRSAWKKIE